MYMPLKLCCILRRYLISFLIGFKNSIYWNDYSQKFSFVIFKIIVIEFLWNHVLFKISNWWKNNEKFTWKYVISLYLLKEEYQKFRAAILCIISFLVHKHGISLRLCGRIFWRISHMGCVLLAMTQIFQ